MKPYLYTQELLSEEFVFPSSFLNFISKNPIPELYPWWFLCTSELDANGWLLAMKRLYPSRKLVPFALWTGTDDVACFDASEPSDDPIVHYVHAYASPGWEDRGRVDNFLEWLAFAEKESSEFKAQQQEEDE